MFLFAESVSLDFRMILTQIPTFLLFLIAFSCCGAFSPTLRNYQRAIKVFGTPVDTETITVGKEIGTGSYGTVHYCSLNGKQWIGKRPLTLEELEEYCPADTSQKDLKAKFERCQYYWNVEEHCYNKLGEQPQLPLFKGTFQDEQNLKWLLLETVPSLSTEQADSTTCAPSLTDLMALDHEK